MATMMAARFEKNGSYPAWVEMEPPYLSAGKYESSSMPPHLIDVTTGSPKDSIQASSPRMFLEVTVSGRVDAVGPETDCPFSSDQRVVINPGLSWGDDNAFQSNHFEILGVPRDGTLAQYVTVPADSIFACAQRTSAMPKRQRYHWRA